MNEQLQPGAVLTSQCGAQYTVEKFLGDGAQGEVYDVTCGGRHYALKWYYPHVAIPAQKKALEELLRRGSPDSRFLWPQDLLSGGGDLGYIMPLRPSRYKGINALLKRRVEPSFAALSRAVYNMTQAYEKLHAEGLCYRDISRGNVFFDPDTGDVLICDTDNVSPSGTYDSLINGTPRFMAPEIVRGEARPSRETDLFSLAVLMFYMLMVAHPLEGQLEANIRCLDTPAMNQLFGTAPVFIYDPNNDSNRPVPGYHDNAIVFWNTVYPQQLKDLFTRSFTTGLCAVNQRVTEKEWLRALANLISGIFRCPNCGCELFYDETKEDHVCWNCGLAIRKPPALAIGKDRIVLWRNAKVYAHHVRGDFDITTILGSAVANPHDPQQRGIRNDSADNWVYIRPDGTKTILPPGRSAAIAPGAKIDFGQAVGEFL